MRRGQVPRPSPASCLADARMLADELASRPNLGSTEAPVGAIARLGDLGLLRAPLPEQEGGAGLGVRPGTQQALLQTLAAIGGGDLALGRIYEGHVNALLLIQRFGTPRQVDEAADSCRNGMLFGVWNTGDPEPVRLHPQENGRFRMSGAKTFATGAAIVQRPIVTGELPGDGWQMTLPRMEALDPVIDRAFWHPLGMESSESYRVDLTGALLDASDLIGNPGDFYSDPLFRGGAVRFAAVQAGAAIRLFQLFAAWLNERQRASDALQAARLGEIAVSAQEAAMWVDRAGAISEAHLFSSDPAGAAVMTGFANAMRTGIERLCTRVMQHVIRGVGAHGLLQPNQFERIVRDLTMYLRQPAPDAALVSIGLAAAASEAASPKSSARLLWQSADSGASLSPQYFHGVYDANDDPWNFETSPYELAKYTATVDHLPRSRYCNALEIGCSIGVLTRMLASRCDALLSVDVSEKALAAARERCHDLPRVHFRKMEIPREMPGGDFDLVVVSEVAYYWSRADLRLAMDLIASRQSTGSHLMLVHWTPEVHDYPLTGDQVHDAWLERPEWQRVDHDRTDRYRLDLLERRPPAP